MRIPPRVKECWPRGTLKPNAAPKILHFIHNLAEYVCVWYLNYSRKNLPQVQASVWFKWAGQIEFTTRNIIADYRKR